MSLLALQALNRARPVVAVVVPGSRGARGPRSAARALARWRSRRPLVRAARDLGVPVLRHAPGGGSLVARLRSLQPDLICVATFPHRLSPELLRLPSLGALGLHPSLLPRHRGPEPLFWTYFHDDAVAGVSLYHLDEGEDTGDVAAQEEIALARGRPFLDLYLELARRGADLLVHGLDAIAAGTAARRPQDASLATREGPPGTAASRVDLASWGCERAWHVLSALGGRLRLLSDAAGRPVPHGPARGFTLEVPARSPGTIERVAGGWRAYCRDGTVELDPAAPRTRLGWAARDSMAWLTRARGA
jgi:folate-dependent phosphoribosylglycinamide formyltransferase PurN